MDERATVAETAAAVPTVADRIFNFGDPMGGGWFAFVLVTLVIFGFGAIMMGRALGETWRPAWHNVAYGLLMGVANRLFHNFFFADDVLNLPAYVIQSAVLIGLALLAYRATRAHKMVNQYPWLYERAGPCSWRELS